MKEGTPVEKLIRDYRERTCVTAPRALREGTLAKLGSAAAAYPLSFSLGAILGAAGLASICSLFIISTGVKHEIEVPPSFFQETPTNSWLSTP
ncbi:hypothetical protein V2O64_20585 [Verrucomicrobiaceae bacterium 227]